MNFPRPGVTAPKADANSAGPVWRRKGVIFALIVALCGIAALAGWPVFKRWQQDRLIAGATEFFRKRDFRSAYVMANRAFQNDPRSVAACRLAAAVAEEDHSPATIFWRQRIADLLPGETAPLTDLAATAIRFGETFIAENAVAQIAPEKRGSVAYLQVAASLAVAQQQFPAALEFFQKALQADPQNKELQLGLATIRVGVTEGPDAENARQTLTALRAEPSCTLAATRALLTDARKRGDSPAALKLAKELRHAKGASLADNLRYLDELQHAKDPGIGAELDILKTGAGQNGDLIYVVASWMTTHDRAQQSADWLATFPAKVRALIPVQLATSETYAALGDWKRLRDLLNTSEWGDLEFLRFAMLAKVADELSGHARRADFQTHWDRATSATTGNPNALSMLARLVTGWGWKAEAAQVWWLIAAKPGGQRSALKALFRIHSEDKNTRELYRVAKRVLQVEATNPIAKNNVASLALLLGEDEAEAYRLAEENFKLAPTLPVFASTYALSLHRQKRGAEAVAVLAKLPPPSLDDAAIAGCYGFLLAENGELEKARPYLEAADRQKEKLFPEEAAMVASALGRRP